MAKVEPQAPRKSKEPENCVSDWHKTFRSCHLLTQETRTHQDAKKCARATQEAPKMAKVAPRPPRNCTEKEPENCVSNIRLFVRVTY